MWKVLARVPEKRQAEMKRASHRISYAGYMNHVQAEATPFLASYEREFSAASIEPP